MIVSNSEVEKRLNSPLNLINKKSSFTRGSAMNVFGLNKNREAKEVEIKEVEAKESFNPFDHKQEETKAVPASSVALEIPSEKVPSESPNLDSLISTSESQIKLGLAHDSALELMTRTLTKLTAEVDNIRADKLPSVLSAAQKTVEGIRRERLEAAKNGKDREVHYHFYTPQQKSIADYGNVIEVEAVIGA